MTVLESYLLANAVSRGVAGVDLSTFIGLTQNFPGGSNSSWEITAKELLQGATGMGDGYGFYKGADWNLQKAVKMNLQKNGGQMVASLVLVPMAFRIGSRLLKKPRSQANRLLRDTGLGVKV